MIVQEKNKNSINEVDKVCTEKIDGSLQTLKKAILKLGYKQQDIISDWLITWAKYLRFERTFKPERLRYYNRGEVIHIHLGFNVGNEQGGPHYAVVVDNYNNRANGCVVVVPISSLKEHSSQSLHSSEVYLGKIMPDSDVESYAQPLQIRCISKIRIIKPKLDSEKCYRLNEEQMEQIEKKIIELFTKNNLTKE